MVHIKLKVSEAYLTYAEDLKAENEKIINGNYNCFALKSVVDKIIESYREDISVLWENYPEMNCMAFRFESGDVFVGKNLGSVLKEAERIYTGKNLEPLLDYAIYRPGKLPILG